MELDLKKLEEEVLSIWVQGPSAVTMMNYCSRVRIVLGIVFLLIVSMSGMSKAESTVDTIMKDIPIHSKGEVAYATTVELNGKTVTGVVYDIHVGVDGIIEYYRQVLRERKMVWTERMYPLEWLPFDGVRVHDFSVHDRNYRLLIPVMDELTSSRSLVAITLGYDEGIYISGKENGGKDIAGLPRFPGSIRTLCIEYPEQGGNPPATVLLYETMSSVENVLRHFNSVLERHGWITYQDYGMNLSMIPGMLTGFVDDRQCMIGAFPDEETGVTNIVIISFAVPG